MNAVLGLAGIVGISLFVYLLYVLFKGENL
ncbi:MAG: potassium-transporting ATPase subunit F [Bacillus sp. (in: Bacteria)]|nr:potassium-transporting ATPase subunit F [Bacillus sp. (in: firmicutes)]